MCPMLDFAALAGKPLKSAVTLPGLEHPAFPAVLAAAMPGVRHSRTSWPDGQEEHSLVDPETGSAIRILITWNRGRQRARTTVAEIGSRRLWDELVERLGEWERNSRCVPEHWQRSSPEALKPHTAGGGQRRVVVTGAAGFIGGHLVEHLVRAGVSVVGVDRRDPRQDSAAAANLAGVLGSPNCAFVHSDLADCSLESVLAEADAVVHLAGIPGVRSSWGKRFSEYATCNLVATQRLMDAAVRLKVPRVVVASSSSVYGRTGGEPSSETAVPAPLSPYAVSKFAAESVALAYAQRADSRTSVAALRYFTVYGPRQRSDMLIGRVLEAARGGPAVPVFGAGDQQRDFTFVSDAVEATVAAALSTSTGVFNIGGGHTASIADIVHLAEEITGRPIPSHTAEASDGDVPSTRADLTRVRTELGWTPQVDLSEGLRQHWDWITRTAASAAEAC